MDKEVKEFCHKYDAYVRESSRMHRRHKLSLFNAWKEDPEIVQTIPYPEIFQTIPYVDIKCVEVHMPEDRFRALLEHDEWLHRAHMSNYIKGNEGVWIVEQHEREARIRHENPSVRLAYEKYQTMLALVESNYK